MEFKPLIISKSELVSKQNVINVSIETAKVDAIPFDIVLDKVLNNNYWNKVTDDEIELVAGFINGDITKPHRVCIGDAHVHALMGGATGKGKSVTLHAIINTLRYTYPPTELAIYHADFKKMEGNKYINKGGSVHHRAITGTSLPSYVTSMFEYVKDQMVFRERLYSFGGDATDLPIEQCSPSQILAKLAKESGISPIEKISHYKKYLKSGKIDILNKKIEEMNIKLKSLGMSLLSTVPTEMPRILFIVDEFQQAFLIDDDDAVDQLKKIIKAVTSKGRALGVHFFFASQNMSGTVPDDVLGQFDLRFILNCNPDISTDLLGNKLANELEIGQCIVCETSNDATGDKCIKVKVPLATDDALYAATLYGQKQSKVIGYNAPKMTYFDETVPEQEEGLKQIILKSKNISKIPKLILGSKCRLTPKLAPLLLDISRSKDSTLIVSTKDDQLYSMLHTVLRNIDAKENATIIFYDSSPEHEIDLSYLKNLASINTKKGLSEAVDLTETLKNISSIYENKTVYLVINKADIIEGLNKTVSYDEDEELIPFLTKLPGNMRLILTANKPSIKQDLQDSLRYILSGYTSVDTQYDLSLKKSLAEEVNTSDYLALYTDRVSGVSDLFKMYMSNNIITDTHSTEDLVI